MKDLDDETLTKLILSIGRQKKWRPFNYIESAELIYKLCISNSQTCVAKKLGVHPETIRQFLNLNNLSSKVKNFVKEGKIGLDAANKLLLLDNIAEQEILADSILKYNLTTTEIRGIVQSLKKRNPNMHISECIEIGLKYRSIIQRQEIIITKLNENTLTLLDEKKRETEQEYNEIIYNILSNIVYLKDSLKSVEFFDKLLFLIFKTYKEELIKNLSLKYETNPNELFNKIISQSIKE